MRFLIGLPILLSLLVTIAFACLRAWWCEQKISVFSQQVVGKGIRYLTVRRLTIANKPLADFDTWIHYLKGNFDLVGPKAIPVNNLHTIRGKDQIRFEVSPGIISSYKTKQVAGIAHLDEKSVAVDFVNNDSMLNRVMFFVVWVGQGLVGVGKLNLSTPDQFSLFGVEIKNITMRQAIAIIMSKTNAADQIEKTTKVKPATFAFVNADCANKYQNDKAYREILNSCSAVFADGIGVRIAARIFGHELRENVNGTDMFPLLCEQLNTTKKRVFLLGAKKTVIDKVAKKLELEYPNIVIADYVDGYTYKEQELALRQRINRANADILLVAMGAPKQEFWMQENQSHINVSVILGVGGLFDFYSETVSRAPVWLRELSLEWVWRLAVQPIDKGKRYLLGNPLFIARVLISRYRENDDQISMIEAPQ